MSFVYYQIKKERGKSVILWRRNLKSFMNFNMTELTLSLFGHGFQTNKYSKNEKN